MNTAFVSTGRDIGGIAAYHGRLLTGLKKIGHDGKLIFLTRGAGKSLANTYKHFGNHDYIIAKNTEQIVNILNGFDLIVHEMPGGFGDHKHFKEFGNSSLPWFYEGLKKVKSPQLAILQDTGTLVKWCPYIDIWENEICSAFISIKTELSMLYAKMRGNLDIYTIDVPIDADIIDYTRFGNRPKIIAMTHRMYPEKRIHFLLNAITRLPEWSVKMYTGRFFFHYAKKIEDYIESNANVKWYKSFDLDYDSIYYNAALVYSASYFGDGSDGGMEFVPMEGAIRGAVPVLSANWVAPHLDSPPEDLCYKININGSVNDISKVISEIDPTSKDYKRRQRGIADWVRDHKSDRLQAKRLVYIYEEIRK